LIGFDPINKNVMPNTNEKPPGVADKATPNYIIWQVTLWDRFAKVSPAILTIIVVVLYLNGFRQWELLIDSLLIMGGIIFAVWWFWAIYTIAVLAYVLEKSSKGLVDVIKEIKEVRKDVVDLVGRDK
jgi:hypothetical protein